MKLITSFPTDSPETKDTDEHQTPLDLFQALNVVYRFTLDPCTTAANPLGTPRYFTRESNGLAQSWAGEVVYCNPPYSRTNINLWVYKCVYESQHGAIVVALLPADTSTQLFHRVIYRYAKQLVFKEGRTRFKGRTDGAAKFGSLIAVFEETCRHEPDITMWNPDDGRFPRKRCKHCPDRLAELLG
jgi:phage N-6-adenine-methyltransferase